MARNIGAGAVDIAQLSKDFVFEGTRTDVVSAVGKRAREGP